MVQLQWAGIEGTQAWHLAQLGAHYKLACNQAHPPTHHIQAARPVQLTRFGRIALPATQHVSE